MQKTISVVIPIYNEEGNIPPLYEELKKACEGASTARYLYEFLFVDDGSSDGSASALAKLAAKDPRVKVIGFSRNFQKELALTAGIHRAKGDAVITIDSDLQQPPALIPDFIHMWEQGAEVVIGVRKKVERASVTRRVGSVVFYKLMSWMSDVPFVPQSTDYRLLDRKVVDVFNQMPERNRLTRGLIDWLGFRREFVYFNEDKRFSGEVSYSTLKLARLAIVSMVSHSLFPLKIAGYLGVFIFLGFGTFGVVMILAKVLGHPWGLYFSGPAEIGVLNGFLIGIVLMSLGIIALYISNVHEEVGGRPLYVVRTLTNF